MAGHIPAAFAGASRKGVMAQASSEERDRSQGPHTLIHSPTHLRYVTTSTNLGTATQNNTRHSELTSCAQVRSHWSEAYAVIEAQNLVSLEHNGQTYFLTCLEAAYEKPISLELRAGNNTACFSNFTYPINSLTLPNLLSLLTLPTLQILATSWFTKSITPYR
jgi:hypothetical protein